MANQKVDVWVGLFVLLGLIALVFLALRAGNLSSFSFAPSYAIEARFDNIGGLKVRAPVKSAGVVVGRVSGIRFDDQTYQAVVSFDIERAFAFPADTSASILTSGLLGEQYIGLDAGGDDRMLLAGDSITLTQSAVVLERLISQFLYGTAEKEGAAGAASTGN
jgi:phospholipid/cholesterol/gamma-HCH transport system substrate-binding protein